MNDLKLPKELLAVIENESIDFTAYGKRNKPISSSISIILFSLFWLSIPIIGSIAFFGPLFKGEQVNFKANGQPVTADINNFEPMLVPSLLLILFLLIGFSTLVWGIISLFKKGGYFVGTNRRLINYLNGNIRYYDWEQFNGNVEFNVKKGDISLQLRTGKMVSRKNSSDKFVPDTIYISGINNILEIEKQCRKRIIENDPTPPSIT